MALKTIWKTERLLIADLESEEISDLQYLYEASSNVLHWDGRDPDPEYILKCYYQGDLPPNGMRENYKVQTIKSATELVGILSIYHGYPKDEIAYLSFMCIGNNFKKQGYGQEIIHHLSSELTNLSFKEIRINVSLKNWSALRFWSKAGFDKINGLFGDNEYSESANGSIELSKFL
jgi:ribosomal protein S18 acetylase RimI-like enzyme